MVIREFKCGTSVIFPISNELENFYPNPAPIMADPIPCAKFILTALHIILF